MASKKETMYVKGEVTINTTGNYKNLVLCENSSLRVEGNLRVKGKLVISDYASLKVEGGLEAQEIDIKTHTNIDIDRSIFAANIKTTYLTIIKVAGRMKINEEVSITGSSNVVTNGLETRSLVLESNSDLECNSVCKLGGLFMVNSKCKLAETHIQTAALLEDSLLVTDSLSSNSVVKLTRSTLETKNRFNSSRIEISNSTLRIHNETMTKKLESQKSNVSIEGNLVIDEKLDIKNGELIVKDELLVKGEALIDCKLTVNKMTVNKKLSLLGSLTVLGTLTVKDSLSTMHTSILNIGGMLRTVKLANGGKMSVKKDIIVDTTMQNTGTLNSQASLLVSEKSKNNGTSMNLGTISILGRVFISTSMVFGVGSNFSTDSNTVIEGLCKFEYNSTILTTNGLYIIGDANVKDNCFIATDKDLVVEQKLTLANEARLVANGVILGSLFAVKSKIDILGDLSVKELMHVTKGTTVSIRGKLNTNNVSMVDTEPRIDPNVSSILEGPMNKQSITHITVKETAKIRGEILSPKNSKLEILGDLTLSKPQKTSGIIVDGKITVEKSD